MAIYNLWLQDGNRHPRERIKCHRDEWTRDRVKRSSVLGVCANPTTSIEIIVVKYSPFHFSLLPSHIRTLLNMFTIAFSGIALRDNADNNQSGGSTLAWLQSEKRDTTNCYITWPLRLLVSKCTREGQL